MSQSIKSVPGKDIFDTGRWMCMHKRFLTDAKEKEPEVLFIGDFTVALLAQTETWEKCFAPLHCINFGISEDQVENVLWRIENGEIDHMKVKVVVLAVGANNLNYSPDYIVEGIQECVKAISLRQPKATIVVLDLLPCGQHPNSAREKVSTVNGMLPKALQGIPCVQVINVDPGFVHADGVISHHDMYDYMRLSRSAYRHAFEPLADLIQQLLLEASGEVVTPEV